MTPGETVLQKVASWRPKERATLAFTDEVKNWSFAITADRNDDLSASLWEVEFHRTQPAASEVGSLEAWANRIATRATGLLEPLAVVEIDRPRCQALLRSASPRQRGNDHFYYELHLTGLNQAILRRYKAATEASRREQIVFLLTHEALEKVVGDIVSE
jgi:hypothetical protein